MTCPRPGCGGRLLRSMPPVEFVCPHCGCALVPAEFFDIYLLFEELLRRYRLVPERPEGPWLN